MNCIHLSEREMIQIELEEMRFCGEILEVETDGDGMKGSIIFHPPDRYYELLRICFKKNNEKSNEACSQHRV